MTELMEHHSFWDYDQLYEKYHRYTALQAKQWSNQGKDTSSFKLLIRPMWRFFREYILQRSFLDGKIGIQTAWIAASYSFNKQARLWAITCTANQAPLAANRPEGRWFRATPYFRSRMAFSISA